MDDNYPLNAIKSFLRIENPKIKDTPFYEINSSQNIITLYNPSEKKYSEKSSKFELDKIFTSDNENSYIFEEICLNAIKECLEGFSYSFISYGETASKKIDVLIGNVNDSVTNINNRGIFPRLLESLLMKINTDEKKYNLLMSFFMVYGNNLVDFSALKDIDTNNISRVDIFSKYFIIKNETDIIKKITKIKIENTEDNLSFINKVIFNLSKIEKETKEKIFSTAHICLILHLSEKRNNEIKNISNISFIILNGSEYLYSSGAKKLKIKDNENNNSKSLKTKKVEGAKNTLETQFTFETIFNCIKSVKCLNIKKFGNQKENFLFSQLTTVLYNICFGDDIEKIKFRIIGTIYPNTGYYLSAKDTIVFLYECRNIMKRKIINSKNLESQNETTSEIVEKKKDDYIFQLETKVKDQKNRINELSKDISRKEDKINFLQKTYKEQINTVKKKLNFPGNINVLIAGGENTKEATFAREMRDYQDIEQLFRRHYRRMVMTATALLGNADEARDIVADLFADLLDSRVVLPPAPTERWLLVCIRNRCLNLLKHRAIERDAEILLPGDEKPLPVEAIERYIDEELTPQTRNVIKQRYYDGKRSADIAREMGISRTAVYKHIVQGIRKLRKHFNS